MSDLEIRTLRNDEASRYAPLTAYAFSGRAPDEQRFAEHTRHVVPERQLLVAIEDGEVVSGLGIHEFGTWYDGVRYPTGGLAGVATVPEKARRGYARQLLRAALAWMRNELGMSLSTLYASVYPLYNGVGWTLAEESHTYSGPSTAFRPAAQVPSDPGGKVIRRLAQHDDVERLDPVYRAFVQRRSGYLDRPRWYWENSVLRLGQGSQPRWLGLWYGSDQQLAGYVLYTLHEARSGASESELRVYELVALRPEGYHGLLSFLSVHHLWDKVKLRGGSDVPWRSLVANPHALQAEAPLGGHVLLRVVDVSRAISQMIAPAPTPAARLLLGVRDAAAPWNDGTWRISTRDGHWSCEPAPDQEPSATLDVSTLAALFSGFLEVGPAIDGGVLEAKQESIPTLRALFSRPYPPNSVDFF